jgi:hypothetical protein
LVHPRQVSGDIAKIYWGDNFSAVARPNLACKVVCDQQQTVSHHKAEATTQSAAPRKKSLKCHNLMLTGPTRANIFL